MITNICEGLIGKIKNQTGTLEQNQTFNKYALTNVNNTYFSLDVPDNWTYVEGSSSSMAELIGFGPKDSVFLIPTEVVVSISNLNTSAVENKSAEIMKQGLVVSVFAQYSDYPLKNAPLEVLLKNITNQIPHQITSRQNLTIDNETAVKIYADGVNDMSGTKFVEYYIMHDKEPYSILYLANAKDFEKYLPEFEQIVKTFKFTKWIRKGVAINEKSRISKQILRRNLYFGIFYVIHFYFSACILAVCSCIDVIPKEFM